MDKHIGLETQPGKWGLERLPASRTILQKITDTLEAVGITVSGIETWPPEEDGRISVTLVIRPRPEPAPSVEYADLDAFVATYLNYDDSCCESVKTVYEKYKNYKRNSIPVNKLDEFCFIRGVIGYFATKYKKVDFFSSTDAKGEIDHCFSNVRLVRYESADPDEKTAAILDAINADKAPGDPPVVRDPCGECSDPDCDTCPVKNGTPIKLYTPEEAAAAMIAGRVLRNEKGDKFYWKNRLDERSGLWIEDAAGSYSFAGNLSGLYEEAKYV
jgi:hypothetical protein